MKHPIQPLEQDEHGVLRFKVNALVRHLLDNGPFDMNTLASGGFSNEDRQQFAQLIGYSLSGYGDLRSYVDDYSYGVAAYMAEDHLDEKDARIAYLEAKLNDFKVLLTALQEPIANLYGIDPSDLGD